MTVEGIRKLAVFAFVVLAAYSLYLTFGAVGPAAPTAIPKECLRIVDASKPEPGPDLNKRPDYCAKYGT